MSFSSVAFLWEVSVASRLGLEMPTDQVQGGSKVYLPHFEFEGAELGLGLDSTWVLQVGPEHEPNMYHLCLHLYVDPNLATNPTRKPNWKQDDIIFQVLKMLWRKNN